MARCHGCVCMVVSATAVALSCTLLGSGIAGLTSRDAEKLTVLDGGEFQWTTVWTLAFGVTGLLLLLLVGGGVLSHNRKLLIVSALPLASMFVMIRFDDVANRAPGGSLDDITAAMSTSLSLYSDDPAVKVAWYFVQERLHCCGVNGYSDWATLFGENQAPGSCCDCSDCQAATSCTAANVYTDGCASKVHGLISDHRTWSVAVATALASLILLLLLGGLVRSCCTSEESLPEYSPLPSSVSWNEQAARNNHANQLNPNNWRYQGRRYASQQVGGSEQTPPDFIWDDM